MQTFYEAFDATVLTKYVSGYCGCSLLLQRVGQPTGRCQELFHLISFPCLSCSSKSSCSYSKSISYIYSNKLHFIQLLAIFILLPKCYTNVLNYIHDAHVHYYQFDSRPFVLNLYFILQHFTFQLPQILPLVAHKRFLFSLLLFYIFMFQLCVFTHNVF